MRERRGDINEHPVAEFPVLNEFFETTEIPEGSFAIQYGGIPIDFSYRDNGSSTVIICFHGAAQSTVSLPWFTGSMVVGEAGANWLSVSDPSLQLSKGLKLAWYAGNLLQPDLQRIITDVIAHIRKVTRVRHLIFFGTSGGGFAALDFSRRFAGSLALPVNPQTSIARHRATTVNTYKQHAWDNETPIILKGDSPIHYDQTNEYVQSFPNTVAYVQNTWDAYHINMHLLPFLRTVGGHPSLRLLLGAWGNPAKNKHVPPGKSLLVRIMKELVLVEGEWHHALEFLGFTTNTDPTTIRDRAEMINRATEANE